MTVDHLRVYQDDPGMQHPQPPASSCAGVQLKPNEEGGENVSVRHCCQKRLLKTRPQAQQALRGGMPRGEKWQLRESRLPDPSCCASAPHADTCPTALREELPCGSLLQRGIGKPSGKARLKNSLDVKQIVKRKGAQAFWTPLWSLSVQLAGIREQEDGFYPYLQLFKGRGLFSSPQQTLAINICN